MIIFKFIVSSCCNLVICSFQFFCPPRPRWILIGCQWFRFIWFDLILICFILFYFFFIILIFFILLIYFLFNSLIYFNLFYFVHILFYTHFIINYIMLFWMSILLNNSKHNIIIKQIVLSTNTWFYFILISHQLTAAL